VFTDIEHQKALIEGKFESVVYLLPENTKLHRARVCSSRELLSDIVADPFKQVGPPPKEAVRAGRMNADGVPVFYCSLDKDTCLAEMRPALKSELAIITVLTTKPLRILDFSRLAVAGKALGYLQPDFKQEVEKHIFLRCLHSLVSQPIFPGGEADYLITQTMSEYLAHVHKKPFDGILFASAQKAGGHNVVLFADRESLEQSPSQLFKIKYVDNSLEFHVTSKIEYAHQQLRVFVGEKGEIHVNSSEENDY
jgi:RES domain